MARKSKHPGENGEQEGLPENGSRPDAMISIIRSSGRERLPASEKEQLWQSIARDLPPAAKAWRLPALLKVAAAVLLLVSAGVWGWRSLHQQQQQGGLLAFAAAQRADTAGTTTRLILGGTQQLQLGAGRSAIAYQQRGQVKINEQLVQQPLEEGRQVFNTLIVPYGNTSALVLEDGTKVWLNAGSRLVYPAAFTGGKREVFLEGEAYFDVAQMAGKPFSVYTSDLEVKVLGTAFNVTAYRDDAAQQVVLTGGSVVLEAHKGPMKGKERTQLTPGSMAAYRPGAATIAVQEVRTDEYVSWKEGHIMAQHTPLSSILKKLSRYYNQPVLVEDRLGRETFSGDLDLQKNLADVLKIIAATTSLRYEQSGANIVFKNKAE